MIEKFSHKTVLLHEAVNGLNIDPNGYYIDGTFGCGGHSQLILSHLKKQGRLLAIDRDPQAVAIAKTINDPRFIIEHGPFSLIANYAVKHKFIGKIHGILFDFGISSPQIDNAERGFSFIHDGPLDMRMDPTHGQSAAEYLRTADEAHISWIIKTFGEERFSKRIARAIIKRNHIKFITRTKELAEIITKVIPLREKHKHPATRTFQAIRIFINNELNEIHSALKNSLNILSKNGRLSIISFHSLEDRIVKTFMRKYSCRPYIPAGIPITETEISKRFNNQLLVLKKILPDRKEIVKNSRARSAILRIAEKIND